MRAIKIGKSPKMAPRNTDMSATRRLFKKIKIILPSIFKF